MKYKYVIAVAVVLGFFPSIAKAEWGYGLRRECNSIYGPSSHQTGIDCTAVGEKMRMPEKKAEVKTEPAPAQQVQAPAPLPPAAKAVPQKEWRLSGVNFETGSDQLKSDSQAALNEAADILQANPRVVVEIQGHTDNIGDEAANASLSNQRALAVQRYLLKRGISADRLSAKGYGETQPIAGNDSAPGRAKNRRIEFKVINQ